MKKENKIWAVTEESAVEGLHDISVKLFCNRKDAANYMDSRKKLWSDNVPGWEKSEKDERDDGPVYFEAWEDGYYDENHVTISMEHLPIE